jgi:hypothetical protein
MSFIIKKLKIINKKSIQYLMVQYYCLHFSGLINEVVLHKI